MSDSKEFSSLFALVDNHLSKTSISSDGSFVSNPFRIPTLGNGPNCSSSEGQILSSPGSKLPMSPFRASESPITNVLAQQVANMLKAKEKKQQEEEKKRMFQNMQELKVEDNDYVIDLIKAVNSCAPNSRVQDGPPYSNQEEVPSRCSSFESLFELKLEEELEEDSKGTVPIKSPLPCITDMSYILNEKVRKAKPSIFARVLTSRLRPVAAPYIREKIESNIQPFDFSTPSPCDIYRQSLRKPTMSCTYTAIIDNI